MHTQNQNSWKSKLGWFEYMKWINDFDLNVYWEYKV